MLEKEGERGNGREKRGEGREIWRSEVEEEERRNRRNVEGKQKMGEEK